MPKSPRTLEQIVEGRAYTWHPEPLPRTGGPHRPAIAVSRLPGAQGDEVAARVAEQLGYELFDREIIHRIAVDARLSDSLVDALDEKNRSFLTDWLGSMLNERHLSRNGYVYHLTRVIGALARQGGAVIVGRGAHLVLNSGEALRVLVTAPLATRVANLAARDGVGEAEARRRVEAEEAARRAFLQQNFRAELSDPAVFDLVVNTEKVGVEGAVLGITAAIGVLAGRPGL